ncbi:MGH1-like glycoside hydrolase domain-containing protein [Telluribacter sp. SYSU D00476]|uniref:MGH1-like glycoside hydrolase domain-containing protein n=1 Tax=Telluribacter sp. SYSU D00476 TaxID=2811430 RepID=UPI001FF2B4F4|nr:glucosidase [Telluribacter sp. SYSU D00476]
MANGAEKVRLALQTENKGWKKWGPYLSERQWSTVREDYSGNGDAWSYITHEMACSKAYRWGEEGIGGFSDNKQHICMGFAFWNHRDKLLKERLFGLTNRESNHGEDVKEMYYYLDSTPTHSYMKMLYKYPQQSFPYDKLRQENARRGKADQEYEIMDTGVFDDDEYFDIFMEYAKAEEEDILMRVTVHNRGPKDAPITVLPTIWFRNTWSWGYEAFNYKPMMNGISNRLIEVTHRKHGKFNLYLEDADQLLFCENETNFKKLYGTNNTTAYPKDGINDYIVSGRKTTTVNPNQIGTKAAGCFTRLVPAGGSVTIRIRLVNQTKFDPFSGFDDIFSKRLREADEFYGDLQKGVDDPELFSIQRQAYAGMLWSKQFYYYNVYEWLKGDPSQPEPHPSRKWGRNSAWKHLYAANLISMPDKWEYPWFAAWDLAFHCIPLARVDAGFAKRQLEILLREYYMHPNGQIPAYEWNFSDVNPPVHAWATWKVYEIDREQNGGVGDIEFLEKIFHKLLLNFTWWVNQKDETGNNIFSGGFLGLDNIGVFDRSTPMPFGGKLEQADATGWMAMYTLNMLRIAVEISLRQPVYQDMASKFFEHFLHIAGAMESMGGENVTISLWDEEDQFYHDVIHIPNGQSILLKVRSIVGLIPLFAVEILDPQMLDKLPVFKRRVEWVIANRPDLARLISRWFESGKGENRLLSILRGHRMKMILKRMLDEQEFLSDYGVRALSKHHKDNPYKFFINGEVLEVEYTPAEALTDIMGGNSNWRGPIWFPLNYLIFDSLLKFHSYYGDDFEVEYPTNSGNLTTINKAAMGIADRLVNIFRRDENDRRAVFGDCEKLQNDPHFRDHILFYEYFHGDNGRGCGASHQTGWTGLVAELILQMARSGAISQSKSEMVLYKD